MLKKRHSHTNRHLEHNFRKGGRDKEREKEKKKKREREWERERKREREAGN